MKANESGCNLQRSIAFFRDLQRVSPPRNAPDKLVRQCKTPTMAMRVSMKASGLKLLACARKLAISESYLSRLINGQHNESGDLPEWFVPAFCWATGSRLLEQYIERQQDERDEESERVIVHRMAAQLAAVAA
jgi:AraC-like DNA-binding protein